MQWEISASKQSKHSIPWIFTYQARAEDRTLAIIRVNKVKKPEQVPGLNKCYGIAMQDRSARRANTLFDKIYGTIQTPAYKRLHSTKPHYFAQKHETCQILQFRIHCQLADDNCPHRVTFPALQDHSSGFEPANLHHMDPG